jgi:hypothetical protein
MTPICGKGTRTFRLAASGVSADAEAVVPKPMTAASIGRQRRDRQ